MRIKLTLLMGMLLGMGWMALVHADVVSDDLNQIEVGRSPAAETAGAETTRADAEPPTEKQQAFESASVAFVNPDQPARQHEFEVYSEGYWYNYQETVGGDSFAGTEGDYRSVGLSYTYRPAKVNAFFEDTVNMFRLEGRMARGKVDYAGTGEWGGLDDRTYEVRGLMGKDLYWQGVRWTPYTGFGYRYLANKMSEIPARIIDGQWYASGYDRISRYSYLPFGFDVQKRLPAQWSVGMNMEYNLLIQGHQESHLEDMKDKNGDSLGFPNLVNDQHQGYGLRGSIKIMKEVSHVGLFVEPFVRYWDIEDSGVGCVNSSLGYGSACGLEPSNRTKEIGMKAGLHF